MSDKLIDVKKYGLPETMEAYLKSNSSHIADRHPKLMERLTDRNPDLLKILIFARKRWTGLKHPLRGKQEIESKKE